jgi:hypothetical protein
MALIKIEPYIIDTTGDFTFNNVTATGNLSSLNANLGNLAIANYFSGSGANLTNLPAGNVSGQVANALVSGTVYTNAQPNITSVGTLTSLTATGNVTGGNLITAGKVYSSEMLDGGTGIYLAAGPSGYINFFTTGGDKATITDTGNIAASNLIANSTIFAVAANISGNVTAGNVYANSGTIGASLLTGTLTTAAQPNITSVGTLTGITSTGTANLIGASNVALGPVANVHISGGTNGYVLQTDGSGTLSWVAQAGGGTVSNISNGNSNVNIPVANGNVNISAVGNANVLVVTGTGANITGTANITGNLSANNISAGSGSGGSITGGNLVSANFFTGTLTTASQPNITSVGTLTSLSVTGNTTSGNLIGPLANGNSNVNIPSSNGNINLTAVGNTTLIVTGTGANIIGTANVTGNLTANNITAGSGSGGNITGGNVISANTFIALASANFVAAANVNLGAVGNVKITGGSSSQYLQTDGTGNLSWSTVASGASSNISNGNSNVNIPSANGNVNISAVGNANVLVVTGTGANITGTANVTGNLSANNITAGSGSGGNITGGNVISANTFTASGNITAGNANLGNAVTANFFIGSGNNLSNIQGGNVSGQVGNALVSGTVYTNAQPNITSVGTLTSLAVTGNTTSGNLIGPLANGNSNVNIPSSNGNINLTAVGNTTLIITGTGANITGTANISGNLSAGNANTGNLLTTNNLSVTTFVTSNLIPNANVTYDLGNTTNRWKDLWLSNSTLYFDTNATVSAGTLTNGNSTVSIPTANGNINLTAVSNTTMVITGTGANIAGTINATGNANAGNVGATGGYFTTIAGSLTTAAQPNITSVGTLTGLTSTGTANLTGASNVSLGPIANVHISGGTNGYVLQTDGSGTLSWVAQSGGGGSASISNGTSNVNIATSGGNVTTSVAGNANILTVTGTGVNVAGTLNVTGQSNLGAVGNVKITGGTANYILNTDGAGNLSWVAPPAGANVTVDNFTGNGVQTVFTLSTTPTGINQTSVNYNGATVLRTDYTLANANITFSSAPANGSYIEVTTINLTAGGGGGASSAAAVGYSLIFGG